MKFDIHKTDPASKARAGTIHAPHGEINTPIFMPVGTAGTVKTLRQEQLKNEVGASIILGNTYHLYLRPGMEVMQQAGGLHQFMQWGGNLLTDSGGYQVYSLSHQRKMNEEGVTFRSHIDGSKHLFTPESVMEVQRIIGADIIMAFDECTPYPCDRRYAEKSMYLTHRWLERCITAFDGGQARYGHEQVLAPIVQGSVYKDLRADSARYIADKNLPINAIGGLSVGEPAEIIYEMTELVCDILPTEKPRYLMGVGTPWNLLEAIARGVDMFDCVLPTRNARHGLLYTSQGMLNMKNHKWKQDHTVIDAESTSGLSRNHSKAYLRHLIISKESLGAHIASVHNLCFYLWLVGEAREQILAGTFDTWKASILPRLMNRL